MTALLKTPAIIAAFLVFLGASTLSFTKADNSPTSKPTGQPTSKPAPKFEFEEHVVILLVLADNPPELSPEDSQSLQARHLEHIVSMWNTGKLLVAGPFGKQDDPKIRGILIFGCSIEEAKAMANEDPAVKAGRLKVVAQTWYHDKGAVTFPSAKTPTTQPTKNPTDKPQP